ncbi:MAG TPA: PTS sugar transporter subunit IIA [Burkholderiaceae bacterium]|nr:PTS sugar transporter subunit IIA [Burkholderiaceae bacterium]
MVAVVVIAHEPLASALVTAAQHVYSRDPCAASRQLAALDVPPDSDTAAAFTQARSLIQRVDQGQGVLVLTDVPGATPCNVAARLGQAGRVAVVAGVNMPMLLRTLCYGDLGLEELVEKALAGGASGIQRLLPTPGPEAASKTR